MPSRELSLATADTESVAGDSSTSAGATTAGPQTQAHGSSLAPDAENVAVVPNVEPPNEVDGVNTDGRLRHDWMTKYQGGAPKLIRQDAWYVAILLGLALGLIFLTWRGTTFLVLTDGCTSCNAVVFKKYSYFFLGGFLGGVLFSIKYLYKVVARGYWNVDRRLWRFFSPFLSGGLALVVGALIDSGVLGLTTKIASGAAYFSYGFITGYFADRAIDKMQEVAETIFGAPGRKDTIKAPAKDAKPSEDTVDALR